MDVDLSLVRRLESSAVATTLSLVDAMRANDPSSPAVGVPMFGGALIVTGPGRYVNRAMGITLDERTPTDIDTLVQFYRDHELPAALEVASWSPPTTLAELARRGFRMGWFRAMFALSPHGPMGRALVAAAPSSDSDVRIVAVDDISQDVWMQTYATGFGVLGDDARVISDEFARSSRGCRDTHIFLATIDGQVAGCGALQTADGIGWVGGAATLPQFRRRGVQAALLGHRVELAEALGCDLVAATALPYGQSARNLVHLGFQHIQTQVVLEQEPPDIQG